MENMEYYKACVKTPLGTLEITENNNRICSALFKNIYEEKQIVTPLLKETVSQIEAYFKGLLSKFDIPLLITGTDFQRRVFSSLQLIEYGKTRSYGQILSGSENECQEYIDNKLETENQSSNYARAVGRAVSKNSIMIIIPCHRVINADGSIGGFSGGLWRKMYLLNMEKKQQCKLSNKKKLYFD